ncbi:MAG: DMT family transporter [Muribaculaceae bacterium]|nr:DMT family transporter [Muribaculaceae bacterium]
MTANVKSIALAAAAVLSWSTVATAFKIAGAYMEPMEMVLVSTLTATVIMAVFLTIKWKWRELGSLGAGRWVRLALLGLVNPVAYYLVLFAAYDRLPAQVAQPVNYVWPIMLLVLLAIFNRQRIPAIKYVGMFVSLAGVACISLGGRGIEGGVPPMGIILALASALLWAFYWLLNRRLCSDIDASVAFFVAFLFASVALVIIALVKGVDPIPFNGLLAGCYIGAFEMAIPFVCFGVALRLTSNPVLVNQLCYLAPFLSLFFISTVLGERILPTTYIGLVLIVGGLIFNQFFPRTK